MDKIGDAAATFAQTYDRDGNVTSESRSLTGVGGDAGSGTQTFTYDGLNRVVAAAGLDQAQGFVYDHDSNRVALASGGASVSYAYDRAGQLLSLDDDAHDPELFAYDASGNLTNSATDFDALTTYAYDAADRLVSITQPDTTLTTFSFDALGRHAGSTTGSVSTDIAYLGTSETAWQLDDGTTTMSSALDADGARLAIDAGGVDGFVLADLHGNPAAAVNAADDAVLSATRYDAYGQRADTHDAGGGFPTDWGFQGRLDISPDAANPLYEFSARFYAPALGAFTQLDSYPGDAASVLSLNRYLYAGANPWTLIDPSGHKWEQGPGGDGGSGCRGCESVAPPPPPPPPGPLPEGPTPTPKPDEDPFIVVVPNPVAYEGTAPCPAGQCPPYKPLPRDPRYNNSGAHLGLAGCASVPLWGIPCDFIAAGLSGAEGDVAGVIISLLGIVSVGDALRPAKVGSKVALDANVLIYGLDRGEILALDAAINGRVPVVSPQAAKEYLRRGDVDVLRQFLTDRGGNVGMRATNDVLANMQAQAKIIGQVMDAPDQLVAGSAMREGITLLTNDKQVYEWLLAVGYSVERWTP
jgi:RHS repeat-associated protein